MIHPINKWTIKRRKTVKIKVDLRQNSYNEYHNAIKTQYHKDENPNTDITILLYIKSTDHRGSTLNKYNIHPALKCHAIIHNLLGNFKYKFQIGNYGVYSMLAEIATNVI